MTEVKKRRSKVVIITSVIIFIFILSFGVFSYFLGNQDTSKDSGVVETIETGMKKVFSRDKSFNYDFFLTSSVDILNEGEKELSARFNIENGSILSQSDGLEQRLMMDGISISAEELGNSMEYSASNIDITSDNEKVYLKLQEGEKSFKNLLDENLLDTSIYSKILENVSSEKYIMVDNSKAMLNVLGELSKNQIIKELITGAMTSNPEAYYKKHGTDEKLKTYLSSDEILDYLFVEGETNTVTNKTALVLNTQVCNDYAPIILAASNDIIGNLGQNSSDLSVDEMKAICESQTEMVNGILPMFLQIYKEGDIESGNYSFVMAQGNIFNVNIAYKNNAMTSWYVTFEDPTQQLSATFNSEKDKKINSSININIDNSQVQISGNIVNGDGNITIESKQGAEFTMNGTLDFKNYMLSKYNIVANMDDSGIIFDLIAKGSIFSGNIDFLAQSKTDEETTEIGKFNFEHKGLKHSLDMNMENLQITSMYNNEGYEFKFYEEIPSYYSDDIFLTDASFSYKDNIITGQYKDNYETMNLSGTLVSFYDFDLVASVENSTLKMSGKEISKSQFEYTITAQEDDKDQFTLTTDISTEKQEGFDVYKILAKGSSYNRSGTLENQLNISMDFGIKEGSLQFEIPTEFREIDTNILENLTIPNYSSLRDFEASTQTYVISGVTVGAVLGTVGYISLTGYSQDAKNSKVIADIATLARVIQTGTTMGRFMLIDLVDRNESYEGQDIIVYGETLINGEDYKVGTINFEVLGQNGDDFISPFTGEPYIIGVTNKGQYQILGFTQEPNGLEKAVIRGNYIQYQSGDAQGLIFRNGSAIKHGDYMY